MIKKYFLMLLFSLVFISCSEPKVENSKIYITPQYEIPNYETMEWVNSDPISIGNLLGEGKVVLIDFWTYTCVNCIRTFPFIKEWNDKYEDNGLVIIGVHTPEFEFEKELKNIKNSIDKNSLDYPVVLDNDFDIWNEFNNKYWPAKYLFNSDGEVAYSHFGEGGYIETENEIRKLLEATGQNIESKNIGTIEHQKIDDSVFGGFYGESAGMSEENSKGEKPYYRMTRELYMGSDRNLSYGGLYSGNQNYYDNTNTVYTFEDNYDYEHNKFYLNGKWMTGKESVSWKGSNSNEEYLAFKFRAKSLNGVFSSREKSNDAKVTVKLNGRYLTKDEAGLDIKFGENSESYFIANQPKMYSILILPKYDESIISFYPSVNEISVFAFTFGSYEEGF